MTTKDLGQRIADLVTDGIGTWTFLICETMIAGAWILFNVSCARYQWDPYPFVLLNLFLGVQAAYVGPVIMMSQNRQSKMDRETLNKDYELAEDNFRKLEIIIGIMGQFERDREAQLALLGSILDEMGDDPEDQGHDLGQDQDHEEAGDAIQEGK